MPKDDRVYVEHALTTARRIVEKTRDLDRSRRGGRRRPVERRHTSERTVLASAW
jgi:hypothetical protein